jgi:hypothetical protein
MASKLAELYDEDFYAWTREQATALRRMAEQRWNGPLDLEHLAEEIEDVGSERRDAAESQVRRVLEHFLKLEHSRATDPRSGWRDSIIDARNILPRKLTPSIRRDVLAELPTLYEQARRKAANSLAGHAEGDAARALPQANPYTFDNVIDDDWYPSNRHGILDELE